MRFRFVHAADLHLDTPFEGLAQVSAEAAALLRDASLNALDELVRVALERDAAFVLLAGDLYDGESRGVRAQLRFLRSVQTLARHDIRTFIVHGNHDPLGGWPAVRQWPAEVTIFGSSEVEAAPVDVGGRRLATIFGLSYARHDVGENLALRFPQGGAGDRSGGLNIGLLHCSVGEQPEHSPYSPCSLADLTRADIDYWALGHIHRAAVLKSGGPWIVYPGNTQGRSPKPAERGPKGAVVVEVADAQVLSVEPVELDAVRFMEILVDIALLGDDADVAGLKAYLLERALQAVKENGGRALLLRGVLQNRGRVHRDLASPGATAELLRDLQDSVAGLDPPLWWESLRDETLPEIDVEAARLRGDFASSMLARADSVVTDPREEARLTRLLTPTSPSDLLRRSRVPSHDELGELAQEASLLALEALEKEAEECD